MEETSSTWIGSARNAATTVIPAIITPISDVVTTALPAIVTAVQRSGGYHPEASYYCDAIRARRSPNPECNALWKDVAECIAAKNVDELVLACERWRRAVGDKSDSVHSKFKASTCKRMVKWKGLTSAIRSGVPSKLRGDVWYICSGGLTKQKQTEKNYADFVREAKSESAQETEAARMIDLDLKRTDVDASMLSPLENILQAFAVKNAEIGYCQGLNFVVAMLLRYVQEEHAFWMICSIVEDLLPQSYYSPSMHGVKTDLKVFDTLVAKYLPNLRNHFRQLDVDFSPFITSWFLCIYMNTLPIELECRVLDCLLHEGSKILFWVGLSIFKARQTQILHTSSQAEAYMLLQVLGNLSAKEASPDEFMLFMHDTWRLVLKSEIVRKLRVAKLKETCAEEAAKNLKRKALHEHQYPQENAESTQTQSVDDPTKCPAGCSSNSSAELPELGTEHGSASWFSFFQSSTETIGVCNDLAEESETSGDETASLGPETPEVEQTCTWIAGSDGDVALITSNPN